MEKVRHLARHGRPGGKALWYWVPSPSLRKLGFRDRRLDDDPAIARRQAEAYNAEADAYRVDWARGAFAPAAPGTIGALVAAYKADDDFRLLAETTRRRYLQCLEIIGARLGDARLKAITPPVVQALKRGLATTPAQANAVLRVLRLLLSFAVRQGFLAGNPARGFRQLRERPRQQVWSPAEEARFLAVCGPELALAYRLAVYTAQREGDVLRLPWSAWDGRAITLRQAKTGRRLEIRAAVPLRHALEAAPRRSPLICTRPDGQPWKADHFRHRFAAAVRAAGLADRRFQDLRRTAVVRLAEAGCTVPEIASISGHGIDWCQRIIDTYLPRTRSLAEAAIVKLERHRPGKV